MFPPIKVPERWICAIADGFWDELEEADPYGEVPVQSAELLKSFSRASKTKHEAQSRAVYEKHGLRLAVPICQLDLKLKRSVPFLKASVMLKAMALNRKLEDCLIGGGSIEQVKLFWLRYKRLFPDHPIFHDGKDLGACIPIMVHADEGRCVKKEQILIINWQGCIGSGTILSEKHNLSKEDQGLNYKGSTFKTRVLLGTLCATHYRKKNRDGHRLTSLLNAIVDDFLDLYNNGLDVSLKSGSWMKVHLVPIAFKGDWPMLAKLGNLKQHFGKKARPNGESKICHLCHAGASGYPYEDHTINAKWYETYLKDRPWSRPSPFTRLPLPPQQELFYRFDPFHCIHKGILAEFAGSAIVARLHVWIRFLFWPPNNQYIRDSYITYRFLNYIYIYM